MPDSTPQLRSYETPTRAIKLFHLRDTLKFDDDIWQFLSAIYKIYGAAKQPHIYQVNKRLFILII